MPTAPATLGCSRLAKATSPSANPRGYRFYQLPAILEAAVIGVADEKWGEVGRAIVVLKEGQSLGQEEIVSHCAANLARFKVPMSVVFSDTLPRNATGKVLKQDLRAAHGEP